MSRFAAFFILLILSPAHCLEPNDPGPYFRKPGMMGSLGMPDGKTYPLTLDIRFRNDKTFTGTFSYIVGLKAHAYEVKGMADGKGRITFHKKRDICTSIGPMLAGGKFEARGNEDHMGGVMRMRVLTETKDKYRPYQTRDVKCTFGVARRDKLYPARPTDPVVPK